MIALLLRARDAKHVAVFTIHEPPNPAADRIDRAEAMVFIADGFSWGAALMAPLWLAAHQLWVALGAFVVVATVLAFGLTAVGINAGWIVVALMALNVWLGFEAPEIQRRTLSANGWGDAGSVSGRNQTECERRFFDMWLGNQPVIARHDSNEPTSPGTGTSNQSNQSMVSATPGLFGRMFAGSTVGRLFSAGT